jgi:3-methyladenine DNA glycosylase AlkD
MKQLRELQSHFQVFPQVPSQQKEFIQNYVGGGQSDLQYLALSIPQVRAILKNKLKLYELPLDRQFEIFEKNWFDSNVFEVMSISLFWLEKLTDEELARYSKKLVKWSSRIDNWAHSDGLCGIYARIFEYNPRALLGTYKKWNRSSHPWLRRISMVGLMYYSRLRQTHPEFQLCVQMVKPHFSATEYYVQKAVGWTLREMYNVYPRQTVDLIENHLDKITPIAWVAASEKLPQTMKKKLLNRRRLERRRR